MNDMIAQKKNNILSIYGRLQSKTRTDQKLI